MGPHRQKQIQVIDQIQQQIKENVLNVTLVEPVKDFVADTRVCLTGVHIPSHSLKSAINTQIIEPLKVNNDYYFYPEESLHMTIKNIRVSNYPVRFTTEDIDKAKNVFKEVIPNRSRFRVYFYRLLLFPNNLALIGTTGEELDRIILDLDQKLNEVGLPDDKKYINSRYFFCNMTLARFQNPPSKEFKDKVLELSEQIKIEPYTVDSVSLVTANSVFKKLKIIDTWELNNPDV